MPQLFVSARSPDPPIHFVSAGSPDPPIHLLPHIVFPVFAPSCIFCRAFHHFSCTKFQIQHSRCFMDVSFGRVLCSFSGRTPCAFPGGDCSMCFLHVSSMFDVSHGSGVCVCVFRCLCTCTGKIDVCCGVFTVSQIWAAPKSNSTKPSQHSFVLHLHTVCIYILLMSLIMLHLGHSRPISVLIRVRTHTFPPPP